MPARRNYRNKQKRNRPTGTVRRNNKFTPSTWNAGISGVPDRLYCKLKYSTGFSLTLAGIPDFRVFRGNSVHDPDYALGGHQPLLHDQLSTLYQRYYVTSSSCVIRFSSNASPGARVVLVPNVSPDTVFSMDTYCEQPRGKKALISNNDGIHRLASNASTLAMYGEKFNDAYTGIMGNTPAGTNPSKGWYWTIAAQAIDGTAAGVINVSIDLIYTVQLFKKKSNQASLDEGVPI